MSLGPRLLASTSRLGVGLQAGPASFQRRAYATPSKGEGAESAKDGKGIGSRGSIQAADEEIAKRREGQNTRRMPAGMDVSRIYENVVMDHLVEPQFQLSWLKHFGFYTNLKEGFKRFSATWQSVLQMRRHSVFFEERGFVPKVIAGFNPRYALAPVAEELTTIYQKYNIAQAKGDASALRQTSSAAALRLGQATAKAIGNPANEWAITRTNTAPYVLSARFGPSTPYTTENDSQVIIRFDYDQTLTRKGGSPKTMRVVENIVFHKGSQYADRWKIRGKVELTPPPFLRELKKSNEKSA